MFAIIGIWTEFNMQSSSIIEDGFETLEEAEKSIERIERENSMNDLFESFTVIEI